MIHLKCTHLLLAFCVSAHATPDPVQEFSREGPFQQFEVQAASPTPFLTGYIPETRECHLLINTSVPQPEGLERTVALAHEAGHCYALRHGLQGIEGGATPYGEAFGDVFALAWVSRYLPAQFEEALILLYAHRSLDRRIDPAYNTLFVMRRASITLPSNKDPGEFTRDLLNPKD